MSILIKSIDMPENCYECFCFQQVKAGIDHPTFNYCVLQNWEQPCTPCTMTVAEAKEGIADYCPLVEISTPHGRLIDADMLEKECCHGCKHEANKYSNCIDCALANAPTVIEAEEEE